MQIGKKTALEELGASISNITEHIDQYKKRPEYFTRNRKLGIKDFIMTTLGMGGNTLNAELFEAYPDINERMTASAYEQAKGKVTPKLFYDLLMDYNKTAPQKLFRGQVPPVCYRRLFLCLQLEFRVRVRREYVQGQE